MRVAASLFVVAMVVGLRAPPALACPASNPPYATIAAIEPADGSLDFPRNGAVRVAMKLWPVVDARDSAQLHVRVSIADGGGSVEGVVNTFPSLSGYVTWTPNEVLRANTRYRVEVTTTTRPNPDFAGPTTATSTFTTSNERAPDLELVGGLRVTLRHGLVDVSKCGPCGMCTKIGERPALLADVELPVVQGGFDAYGYQAWFTLNDRSAPMWIGPGEGKLDGQHSVVLSKFLQPTAGMRNFVTQELPVEDHSYTACFGFNAWDPIQRSKSADSVCIPASEIKAAFAALDAMPEDAGVSPGAEPDAAAAVPAADSAERLDAGEPARHETSGVGCSVALHDAPARRGAGCILLLAVIAYVRRRSSSVRRRRAG